MEVVTLTVCIACLQVENVDADGLCKSCNPDSEEMRTVLLDLLKEPA